MKSIFPVAAFVIAILIGILRTGTAEEVPANETVQRNLESSPAPKIMITAGTEMPNGAILSEAEATSGTIDGTLEVENLTIQGPLTVDGQVLVGNELWCPLRSFVLKSGGNAAAAPPGKPVLVWKNVKVDGALIVDGSLIVHQRLSPVGNMSIAGGMGSLCNSRRVFFPAGAYPIASKIEFGCPRS